MSYTKHTWQNEEIITADKLNNMEEGISSFAASNTITGYLQDGDILTVQTSDGNSKKIIWKEINVPLTYVKEKPSGDEFPSISSDVDTESLFKLLNSHTKAEIILINEVPFFDTGNTFMWGVMQALNIKTSEENGFTFTYSTNVVTLEVVLVDILNVQCIYLTGDTTVNDENLGSFSLLVRGFLPVEN